MGIQKLVLDDGTANGVVVHVEVNDRGNHRIIVGPESIFPLINDKEYHYMLCNQPKVGDRLEVNCMRQVNGTFLHGNHFFTDEVRMYDTITV